MEDVVKKRLLEYLGRVRRYMPFFEWPDRRRKELGILKYLLESMEKDGIREYLSPLSASEDPPDCLARDLQDNLVGFEITELVSAYAIRENQRSNAIYRDWDAPEVLAHTEYLLRAKDAKVFHGGPYSKRITVIFTDEITIPVAQYQPLLSSHRFTSLPNTDEAYFLFPYDGTDRCPYVRLAVSKSA